MPLIGWQLYQIIQLLRLKPPEKDKEPRKEGGKRFWMAISMGAAMPDAELSNPFYYQSIIFISAYHNPKEIYVDFCSLQVRALIPELQPDNWKIAWKSNTKEGENVNLKTSGTCRIASKQAV